MGRHRPHAAKADNPKGIAGLGALRLGSADDASQRVVKFFCLSVVDRNDQSSATFKWNTHND